MRFSKDETVIRVDGQISASEYIGLLDDGQEHFVDVTLGFQRSIPRFLLLKQEAWDTECVFEGRDRDQE